MKRLSQSEVKNYYKKFGYELLSEYKNMATPLEMKCPKGHITKTMNFGSFKRGCRCSVCSKRAKLQYSFVKEQFEKEGYTLISKDYKNANTKLKTICPKGHNWEVTYGHFYDGKRCGECDPSKKLDYNFVKSEFEKRGYILISKKYINACSSLEVICPKGHFTNTITWHNFKKGQGCKICNESKGEKKIAEVLDKNNIKYTREYRFEDCKDKYTLPFDFYLGKINNTEIIIEYDGIQHFKAQEHLGGEEELVRVQKRDNIKNEYCKKNNINLIRIPYWEFKNIEKILLKNLNLV